MSRVLTPSQRGFRMPAEWEPHHATWLSWPHNTDTWPDELDRVEAAMAQVVQAVARHERVYINVLGGDHEVHVRHQLDALSVRGDVVFCTVPTNDAWVRDHGAIFLVREGDAGRQLAATNWGFNSWGEKYPPFDLDNEVPPLMAEVMGAELFSGDMILEGGSIDVDGQGQLLTTESCLLNPNRNPDLDAATIEQRIKDLLGIRQVLWLHDGIKGDDTDGHIDDITRFVAPGTVLTVVDPDPQDPNHDILQENMARLRAMTTLDGRPFEVVELPMPAAVALKGDRMPASYANFYIANGVVVVPVYGDPNDGRALDVIGRAFPGREIAPVNCRELIWGLGAIHCLTQQVPAFSAS